MNRVKKLLTLDDLVKFCKKEKFYSFSAQDTGYQLAVQIPSTFEISNEYIDNTLLFCNVKLFHIGENRNRSSVTKDAAIKSLSTVAYKPLLANFCEIDGVRDFTSHDMIINKNGDIEYIERQIGCFTSDMPEIKYDEETDKEFVFARVAIPREYTDACDIIKRKNGTKVSVELLINEMQYSVKDNLLELTDIIVSGATCLGKNPETGENVDEGMQGARLAIEDFSDKNNSVVNTFADILQEKMIEVLEKLNATLSNFNKDTIQKGGNEMNKFEELLEKYSKTVEDIEFEYSDMTDEELEAKFAELFDGEGDSGDATSDSDNGETGTSDAEGGSEDVDPVVEEADVEVDPVVEDGDADVEDDDALPKKKIERDTLKYELSHDDIRYALYGLLNALSEDGYCTAWIAEVYDDKFIYEDYVQGKCYRQKYSKDNDNVTLEGEPVEVFSEWLSKEEKDALDALKADYSTLKSFKEQYDIAELTAQKSTVLESVEYVEIKDSDEFKALVAEMDKYSVEELKIKADLIFAASMKKKFNFEATQPAKKHAVTVNINAKPNKKKEAYAGIFADKE